MAKTVLVVEDDPDLSEELTYLIQRRGYTVATAEHGADALDQLEALDRPCIIVLDLMMPVMDGFELRAELLRNDAWSSIPIVVVSGIADLQREANALDVAGYVSKPIDLDRLYHVIDAHCCRAVH
jgi:DNA-binding response OmpR family regulator